MRRRLIDQFLGLFRPATSGGARPKRPTRAAAPGRPPAAARPGGVAPSRDIADGPIRFEYSPDLDGDADPGEVVWTWVPYEEDPSQGKDRPVAVLARRGGKLLGVPLTSRQRDDQPQVAVGAGPWDREGRPSFAKLERLLEIDAGQVRREGAVLTRRQFDAIVAGVRREQTR